MFDASTLLALLVAAIALAFLPGPSSMLILSRSIAGGRKVGLATCAGSAFGSTLAVLAAALGLSALLMTSSLAFTVVKWLGAIYLAYLGVRMWLEPSNLLGGSSRSSVTPLQAFSQGVLTDITNPKTALFFSAFLPQFIQPERGGVTAQFVVLGLITVLVLIIYAVGLTLLADSVRSWLMRNSAFVVWQSRIVGTVFVGFGLRLALAKSE